MAAVRQRRSAACLYYVFCAWMMMATVLHVQYAADTPFLLKANSVWANLAGLAVSSIGALANGLGAHRLKLRVIDAAWCYGFYTYAHGSNCLTGVSARHCRNLCSQGLPGPAKADAPPHWPLP